MRGVGVVFTPQRKNTVHPNMMPATIFSADFHHDEDELDEAAEGCHFHPVLVSTLSVPSLCQANG